ARLRGQNSGLHGDETSGRGSCFMTNLHLATALAITVAASSYAVVADSAGPQTTTNPPSQEPAQPSKADTKKTDNGKKTPRKRVVSDLSGFDLLGSGKQTTVVGATRSAT